MKYDIVIVGAGPSGYFCAYELVKKDPSLKVLLIDKGLSIEKRRCPILERKLTKCPNNSKGYQECYPACAITNGFGGAGAYSDGKFNITTEFGGWLTNYMDEEQLLELIHYIDEINLSYGASRAITDPFTPKVREIEKKAMSVGLKLLHSRVRHFGTEENLKILTKIYLDLKEKIDCMFSTVVRDIVVKNGRVTGVITDKDQQIDADYVLLSVGREGSQWLTNLFEKYNVEMTQNQVDIGVRVECPNLIMEEINVNLYEGKFLFKTSTGSTVRTFCSNPGGHVVVENYQGVVNVNGHSYKDLSLSSENTNFALLVTHHFEEPFKKPNEYALKVSSIANQLACGTVLVQRFGDLLQGRRSTVKRIQEGFVVPTLKEAVPGDLALCLPQKTLQSIIEMIKVLDHITPGIATEHTLLYGVEAKYYSAHPEIDNKLEVKKIKNLYVGGDGAGLTRGLAQAGASGIYVARNILSKIKKGGK
ncbi:MAG TPA: NAD(P)/FAD-dependent oxidoreductase [Erysipelotrichaceae bacterium]|nr:NAD(P)/FAD-dependent oxidoreductase [Erysipelotrichaceae bacterium]